MIGIDVGRASVKVSTSERVFAFPSVVGEARDLRLGDGGEQQAIRQEHLGSGEGDSGEDEDGNLAIPL